MTFGKTIRAWSAFHEVTASSKDDGHRFFSFICSKCGKPVQIELKERLNDWGPFPRFRFSGAEKEAIRTHYAMSPWSRSPSGGDIHFDEIPCPECQRCFLLSYGIREPNNGLLLLTVDGVMEIIESADKHPPE